MSDVDNVKAGATGAGNDAARSATSGEMSAEKLAQAQAYQREHLTLGLVEEAGTLMFLMAWTFVGPMLARACSDAGWGRYAVLAAVAAAMYVSYQLVFLGLDFVGGYRLEKKYDLSTESIGGWAWRHTKMVGVAGAFLAVLVGGLYSAVWYLSAWVVWCWAAWIVLNIVLAQIFPVLVLPLFYKTTKLDKPTLEERIRALAAGTGVTVEGVYRLELSESTRKGNAMLAGVGATRRVLLGDTLLDRLSDDEMAVVVAHELGHHVHGHFTKLLALQAVGSVVLFAALWAILGAVTGAADVAEAVGRLGLVALATSLFGLAWRPITNAATRYFERQSDRYALERTKDPAAFVRAFEVLADQNLADPNPPRWVVIMYHDHPTIAERIAAARAWAS